MRGSIAIAGSLAQKPHHGGHSWALLQYLLGFRKLGWDVLFLDVLTEDMCFDETGNPCEIEHSVHLKVFQNVMERFGFQDNYSLLFDRSKRRIGLSRQEVFERVGESEFLLNVMGFLQDREIIDHAPRHVFLDIDPGFPQMWESLGLATIFDGYDEYVTIGERIGQPSCNIPTCGISWITTPQPVNLDYWPVRIEPAAYDATSVISWRGAYEPVTYGSRTYGLRVHEFRKFLSLPKMTGQSFQLALSIDPEDSADISALRNGGWNILDPREVAGDPWTYRSFIQDSSFEFMVAKNIYVETRSGWFSDRSICYLASGRPVLAQDTGISSIYPTGEGLLLFETLDEAVDGIERIRGDYSLHARAARDFAETHFEARGVLGRLLGKLGVF